MDNNNGTLRVPFFFKDKLVTQFSDCYAAIDLGSNSFHMMIVRNVNGVPHTIAKVKRKVRLAAGLNPANDLSLEAMERGWQCLALFAERLMLIPVNNIKIVSTATLRLATNAQEFCDRANEILGQPIDIISGDQEASLIYHGMAVTSGGEGKRLIIDIGGASTELILGQGFEPIILNSLNMGCVSWLDRHFGDRALSASNFEHAIKAAAAVLGPVKSDYLSHQWQLSLGASGSIQAVQEVLIFQGLNEKITLEKLELLLKQTIDCGCQKNLNIKGLKEERKPVFASGLAILIMLFRELSIDVMVASGGALREGLIAQLIALPQVDNLALATVKTLQQQYDIDIIQADQVSQVALTLAVQLGGFKDQDLELLNYSAMLHEIGLTIRYLDANEHGGYLINHLTMPGFSIEQQRLVSGLIANYKNSIQLGLLAKQAWCGIAVATRLMNILRLAVIITGRYQGARVKEISISQQDEQLQLQISENLTKHHPLLMAELNLELQ